MNSATSHMSRYLRTTDLFEAAVPLCLPFDTQICFVSQRETDALTDNVRMRNVFARHSRENNFYLSQIASLANKTVIESLGRGDPDSMIERAQLAAEWAEKTAFLSATLAMPRKELHRVMGVDVIRRSEVDMTIGQGFKYLRSTSRRRRTRRGIGIDAKFVKRFTRFGFPALYSRCITDGELVERLRLVMGWLYESRQESHLPAAIVKTSIALESLLIGSESEPLAKTLSERTAFILSSDPATRERISVIVKDFYDARSGVVHGSQKKAKKVTEHLLDGMDRLIVLMCLIIASENKWSTKNILREWCEEERWGNPSPRMFPFPPLQLSNAISLCEKERKREVH
jgi:hypothetical protein